MGGLGACKNFEQTVRFVEFLESKIKEYLIETGENFPGHDSARVLSEALDEETLSKIDDSTTLRLTSYEPAKEWILQRDAKAKSRKATRQKSSSMGPDDMVFGVENKEKQAAPTPTEPAGADPWLTSADP